MRATMIHAIGLFSLVIQGNTTAKLIPSPFGLVFDRRYSHEAQPMRAAIRRTTDASCYTNSSKAARVAEPLALPLPLVVDTSWRLRIHAWNISSDTSPGSLPSVAWLTERKASIPVLCALATNDNPPAACHWWSIRTYDFFCFTHSYTTLAALFNCSGVFLSDTSSSIPPRSPFTFFFSSRHIRLRGNPIPCRFLRILLQTARV